jgi:hypothetical protein
LDLNWLLAPESMHDISLRLTMVEVIISTGTVVMWFRMRAWNKSLRDGTFARQAVKAAIDQAMGGGLSFFLHAGQEWAAEKARLIAAKSKDVLAEQQKLAAAQAIAKAAQEAAEKNPAVTIQENH